MTNSADPDQLASSEANGSGSTLFAKTGHDVFSMRRVKKLLTLKSTLKGKTLLPNSQRKDSLSKEQILSFFRVNSLKHFWKKKFLKRAIMSWKSIKTVLNSNSVFKENSCSHPPPPPSPQPSSPPHDISDKKVWCWNQRDLLQNQYVPLPFSVGT